MGAPTLCHRSRLQNGYNFAPCLLSILPCLTANSLISLVREAGLEPARAEAHKILSLARLPVSPLPLYKSNITLNAY